VESLQCGEKLERDLRGVAGRERTLLQTLGQRFAFDEFHDQDEFIRFFRDVIEAAGVRMSDLRGGAGLLPEARTFGGVVGAVTDEFESYGAIEALVLGLEDNAHAALADLGKDTVRANRVWETGQATRFPFYGGIRIPKIAQGSQQSLSACPG